MESSVSLMERGYQETRRSIARANVAPVTGIQGDGESGVSGEVAQLLSDNLDRAEEEVRQ